MSTVQIKYNGQDITDFCSIAESSFTTASTQPGTCRITFKDTRQKYRFVPGKTLELLIDGKREWDGYLMSLGYNYWFATHTADCEPCPHVTPRKLILNGTDRNVLLLKRVQFDPSNPTDLESPIWPAGTMDRTILLDHLNNYVDDLDGVDYTSMVEEVGSPDEWQDIISNGPGTRVYDLIRDIAKMVGAVYYIDPDRRLIYTDVETPNADFGLSDNPGAGQAGYRDLQLLHDATRMVNDALIWGAGQGSENIKFHRTTDVGSLTLHGRWQNSGGWRSNLYIQDSLEHTADTIVYGSPSNKRGHKDDGVSVRCSIIRPGLRVGEKVVFESEVHDFTDVIPIREMTITFAGPGEPIYELLLSHEFDEPWTTQEYWWPPPKKPEPETRCYPVVEGTIDYGLPLGTASAGYPPSTEYSKYQGQHASVYNSIDDFNVAILAGMNVNFFDYHYEGLFTNASNALPEGINDPLYRSITGSRLEARYTTYFADLMRYSGTVAFEYWFVAFLNFGERMWDFLNRYTRLLTPYLQQVYIDNGYDEDRIGLRLNFTIYFSAWKKTRQGAGFKATHTGDTGVRTPDPHQVSFAWARAPNTSVFFAPRTAFSNVIWAGEMEDGDSLTIERDFIVPAHSVLLFSLNVLPEIGGNEGGSLDLGEILIGDPFVPEPPPDVDGDCVGGATAYIEFAPSTWYPVRGTGAAYIADIEADGPKECIPSSGPHCSAPTLVEGNVYRVGSPYMEGSSKLYLDGVHTSQEHYTEYGSRGEFELDVDPGDADLWFCYTVTSGGVAVLPDTALTGMVFIVPTWGTISGGFGPHSTLYPALVWHGTYYAHFHNGVDFAVPAGTPIFASADGRVAWEDQAAGGIMIHIYHPFHGFRTTYAHLSSRVVADGAEVQQGQHIGYSGNTGNVTGAHLHWGLTYAGNPENPMPYTSVATSPDDPPISSLVYPEVL